MQQFSNFCFHIAHEFQSHFVVASIISCQASTPVTPTTSPHNFVPSRPQKLVQYFRKRFPNRRVTPGLIDWDDIVRREVDEMKNDTLAAPSCCGARHVPLDKIDWDTVKQKWSHILRSTRAARTSTGNRLTLLVGTDCLATMLEDIHRATERVWLESYIFDGSEIARTFVDALLAARARGVDVMLIVDWLGAFDMKAEWISELRVAGANVVVFNDRRSLAFRDHRKLAVIDCAGYCGSTNIMQEAASLEVGGTEQFFDVHVKVEGPAVADIGEVIRDSPQISNSGVFRPPLPAPAPISYEDGGGSLVQVLESNAVLNRRTIQQLYRHVIAQASISIAAMTGYFSPPWMLRRGVKAAMKRQVPLTLVMSGKSDVWFDVFSAKYAASTFLVSINVATDWFRG